MASSMLTDNKNRRKKKIATILCPVIMMLVESRFIFICNNPPPQPRPPTPRALFRKTSNTHVELFPKFGPQNKFFDNQDTRYKRYKIQEYLFKVGFQIYNCLTLALRLFYRQTNI